MLNWVQVQRVHRVSLAPYTELNADIHEPQHLVQGHVILNYPCLMTFLSKLSSIDRQAVKQDELSLPLTQLEVHFALVVRPAHEDLNINMHEWEVFATHKGTPDHQAVPSRGHFG